MDVAVIVPVRDGERYLRAALESVASQTLPPAEVVVVDDGSRDRSADIAESMGVTVLRRPPSGIGPSRDAGVAATRSPLLAFLDADDLWAPRKLELQVDALRRTGRDASLGAVEEFWSPDVEESMRRRRPLRLESAPGPGALVILREAFLRIGPFGGRWVQAEWLEWWARATEQGLSVAAIEEVVLRRRLHANNHSHRGGRLEEELTAVLKRSLDRRRSGGR